MRTIEEVEIEWLALFEQLIVNPKFDSDDLAAPFLSVFPPSRDPLLPLVLYVGQATYGPWYLEKFLDARTVEERRECTATFLQTEACTYPSAFWRFGVELSRRLAPKGAEIHSLQNIVWTNISKIGQPRANPDPKLRKMQRDLAIETLRLELDRYEPKLVVFATGDYEDVVIDAVMDDPQRTSWHQERNADSIWWREARDGMPTILWVYHPERKSVPLRELWLQQACELFQLGIVAAAKG
jgi:hypothetical protein